MSPCVAEGPTTLLFSLFIPLRFPAFALHLNVASVEGKCCQNDATVLQIGKRSLVAHSQLSLLSLPRYWKERDLRQDRHASRRLPDDVSGPVLPQVVEHYGKCAALPAGLRSNEGALRRRLHWGAAGL